jgi:flagellar biosynthetic protein FlhB
MLPLLGLFFLAGVAVHLGQTGFLFVPEKLGFDLQRINPLQNYKRIFSLTSVVHLALGLLKIMLIATVAAWSLWGERGRLMNLADLSTAEIGQYLFHVTLWTSLKIGCSLLLLALFDYGYQYWKHEQDLRMSTQEMREEMKSQQGDPQVAQRRKAVQRQLMLNRLGSSVPTADVVITNPTELAIALKYDSETMAAPVVIAKGAGVLAQRIRRLALESNVPIVERKELARALYKNVDLNQPVPSEQYAAVAEVVRYVYQLQGKSLPGRR